MTHLAIGGILITMIRAVRRSRLASSLASLGLCAVLTVIVSSPMHDGTDDPSCNPPSAPAHPHADRLSAPDQPSRHAQHCLLCHAVQSVRAEQQSSRFSPPLAVAGLVASGPSPAVHAPVSPFAPARAPPLA